MRKWNGVRVGILGLIIAASMVSPGVAVAADLKVTTSEDGDDKECSEEDCTLREAVARAGPGDRVILPAGHYRLTTGELLLVGDVIVGEGARTTLIDAAGKSRVLRVVGATSSVSGSIVSGVTIAGGFVDGVGGGVFVKAGATLELLDSTVRDNTAAQGGGIAAAGKVELRGSNVSNNMASSRQAAGGGIFSTGALGLVNSTVSGNTAVSPGGPSQGGGVASAGELVVDYSTIANNSAASGGLALLAPQVSLTDSVLAGVFRLLNSTIANGSAAHGDRFHLTAEVSLTNSVLEGGTGGACAGMGLGTVTATNNVADDGSCQLKDPSNRQDVDTALGRLADNGGPTDTHALLPASVAINAAGDCIESDQRGVTRPQTGHTCDSGSYEYRAPALRVTMAVTNDDGGTRAPRDFTVQVRPGGAEDGKGSPQPGDADVTTYVFDAGTAYEVSADSLAGYTLTMSGDCTATLQEGENRACTITANDIAPTLRVITNVVSDHGGSALPSSFTVRVRKDGADVDGSPQPGNAAGTTYTLTAGSYAVSADALGGYTTATSGDCAADGSVTLAVGDNRTCTITADDNAPPVRGRDTSQEPPPPEPGKSVNALPKSGTVRVKLPGQKAYVTLDNGELLPVGTLVDARKGHVTLIAAVDRNGGTATAEFWAGIFRLGQTQGAAPITTLKLVEKLSCPRRGGKASSAAKRKKKRRLWGNGSGRFRTSGKYSSATVRGTKWLVEDRCTSTLTRAVRGSVTVRDFVEKKDVVVKRGKRYVAKAAR